MQERFSIIDKLITKFFEHEDNHQDESSNKDRGDYLSMFVMPLPYVIKPTVLNVTIFLFVERELTSFMHDLSPANFHDTNTSSNTLANAHSNAVLSLE